jgi:hypothetical protein
MAKLIKLSTTTDLYRSGNTFNCLCDEDIIIEANSKISLLNCQISSGILKDYEISGSDVIDGEIGEIWGTLDLIAPADPTTKRRLLLRNGNYNITQLCQELKRSILNSLVSCSAGGYATTQTTTLPMPLNSPDFELCVDVLINSDNKIQINYNSKPILLTADVKFSNLKPGIVFDAQSGLVSWGGGGAVADEIPIDPTKTVGTPGNATITTLGVPSMFAVGDVGTLMDFAGGTPPIAYTVTGKKQIGTNLQSAIALDNTINPPVPLTVYSTQQTNTRGFKPGDTVSVDDGTSVEGALSANWTNGVLQTVDVEYLNEHYPVKEFPDIPLKTPWDFAYSYVANFKRDATDPNNIIYSMDISASLSQSLDGDYFYYEIQEGASAKICAVGIILSQTDTTPPNAAQSTITFNLLMLDGFTEDTIARNIGLNNGVIIAITNSFYSQAEPNIGELEDYMPVGTAYWMVGKTTGLPAFRVDVLDFEASPDLSEIQINLNLTENVYEVFDGNNYLIRLPALKYIVQNIGVDWGGFFMTPAYCLVSSNPLLPSPTFNLGDTVAITVSDAPAFTDMNLTLETALTSVPINGDDYTKFVVAFNAPDQKTEFLTNQRFISQTALVPIRPPLEIFKNSSASRIKFVFQSVVDQTKLAGATRIWEGNNIFSSWEMTLNRAGAPPLGFDLSKYSDFVKGDLTDKYGAGFAFALCDNTCNPGPGRCVFQIASLPDLASGCEFGLIEVGNTTFDNLTTSNSAFNIKLERGRGAGNQNILVYNIYQNGVRTNIGAGSQIQALAGDRIAIQWNTCFGAIQKYNSTTAQWVSLGDKQYVGDPKSPQAAAQNPARFIAPVPAGSPDTQTREEMRNNVTFCVMRSADLNWQYLGAPNTPGLGTVYPYTPLNRPVMNRIKFDVLKKYTPFIRPGIDGEIKINELVANPMVLTDNNGVVVPFDGTNYINHPDYHTPDIEISSTNPTKYTDPASSFQITFTNPRLQKQFGFSEAIYLVNGASGSIKANKSYLEAYLPENLMVLLDTAPAISSFDCGQTIGKRRQILCTSTNFASLNGDINIEPSNLFRISLGNKAPINSRKFSVSFETFYGEQVILRNAQATITLLVEPPE